jgi:hypothetical protein
MIPISYYRRMCQQWDVREFAQRHPEPVLVQIAIGSQMVAASSPRETLYRGQGLGTRRRSKRASGSAYLAYRVKKKRRAADSRMSIGFLRSNDVVIHEASVSRVHAYIQRGAEGYLIIDAGSTHGVKVNDVKLELGRAAPLRSGDRVLIGNVSALFLLPEDLHSFVRRVVGG